MGETTTTVADHQLWVSLNALGEGNVFELLPDVLKKMLAEYDSSDLDEDDFCDVILPSDDEWRTKIYYKLVEKQRLIDNNDETMLDHLEDEKNVKLHYWNIKPKIKTICEPVLPLTKKKDVYLKKITWTVSDIAKAGCLLQNPPLNTDFEDEQEMRRVYTLIYDAFRYKNVLNEALNNVSFFGIFPKLAEKSALVWLLLYDLYHRRFNKRETKVQQQATKLFESTGLIFVENALWTQKVKLAAAISRQRIKNNALTLSDLLPAHLQDNRMIGNDTTKTITCWINTMKVENPDILCKEIEDEFELKLVDNSRVLDVNTYKWDKHCPQIIEFHNSMRARLSRSNLVKNYKLILQDRSFCLGPATFGKLIADLELAGSVIQTHVNSPRTTAYLAILLSHNEKIKKLLAFSAGQRKVEYESYFSQLGMTNILIFAERLIDTRPDAQYMEEVVAVFATPPNSYSAVADPIDLVCSRGGDLTMLQVLTDSEDSQEGRERVANVLDEQRKTLRFAMSRPQIQFVLYETHSGLDAENNGMVNKALNDINKIAKIHHATLQGKLILPSQPEEVNNNDRGESSNVLSKRSSILLRTHISDEKVLENIKVPDTDVFDVPTLPVLCPSNKNCANLPSDGCFLSLIQRKQIIKLDDKYMIQMAETRGLFGNNASTMTAKSKSSRASKKKVEKEEQKPKKLRKRLKGQEIERMAAPTHTFLNHICPSNEESDCERCEEFKCNDNKQCQFRRWWGESTRHIIEAKTVLVKKKLVPTSFRKIDEILARSNVSRRIPVFPRLRLSRYDPPDKIEIPITIKNITFPTTRVKIINR